MDALFTQLHTPFEGKLDGLLHGIAFSNKDDLSGEYVATSKAGFTLAHESSAYTLVALARGARPMMQAAGGGSMVTLTYLGAERVIPNYNIMGVAKASLEASVRYLASDLGAGQHSRERYLGGADQNAGGKRDCQFRHDAQTVCGTRSVAPRRRCGRGWRRGDVPAESAGARNYG